MDRLDVVARPDSVQSPLQSVEVLQQASGGQASQCHIVNRRHKPLLSNLSPAGEREQGVKFALSPIARPTSPDVFVR
jgi:hypothetical protein